MKAVHLALELEAVRSEAATEDSIDQLNIVRRYGLSPSNNFVINKYFYLVRRSLRRRRSLFTIFLFAERTSIEQWH